MLRRAHNATPHTSFSISVAGNTGFKVFDTAYGRIGVGICWDQWFPECARAMVLQVRFASC